MRATAVASCGCSACDLEGVPGVRYRGSTFCELCWYLGTSENNHARNIDTGRLSRLLRRVLDAMPATPPAVPEGSIVLGPDELAEIQRATASVDALVDRARDAEAEAHLWRWRAMWLAFMQGHHVSLATGTSIECPKSWDDYWRNIDATRRTPQHQADVLHFWHGAPYDDAPPISGHDDHPTHDRSKE